MRILSIPMFLYCLGYHRHLPSFPTRRSSDLGDIGIRLVAGDVGDQQHLDDLAAGGGAELDLHVVPLVGVRSEEHTSELQSRGHIVCRLLLEKKKRKTDKSQPDGTNNRSNHIR